VAAIGALGLLLAGISARSVERRGTAVGSSERSSEACFGGRRLGEDGTTEEAQRMAQSWPSARRRRLAGRFEVSSGVVMNFFRQKAAATKLRPWVYHVSFSNSILTVWEYLLFNHELNATSQYRTTDFADHGSTTHRSHFDHTGQLVCYYVLLY
jgi:hypothetical protein